MMTTPSGTLMKFMALSNIPPDIQYPVFKLPSKYIKAYRAPDGVLYAETLNGIPKIVDTVKDGAHIGIRRLSVPKEELADLGAMLLEPKDVILSSAKLGRTPIYLDSNGRVFGYKKTDWAKVRCYEIEKFTPAPHPKNFTVLKLRRVHCPIPSAKPPGYADLYASLLCFSNGYLFMGYSEEKHEPYRVKI